MAKKLTYEFVKSKFEEEGYELLSTEYRGAHSVLKCMCPSGHIVWLNWQKFKHGRRCKYCNGSAIYFSDIEKEFSEEGYKLLTVESEYNNDKQKLKSICPDGHICEVSYRNWLYGRRCKICFFNSISTNPDDFKKLIKSLNYKLLDEMPDKFNRHTKLLCECSEGHKFYTAWSLLIRGHGCRTCAYIKLSILNSGCNGSNWQGGKSFEEYCAVWRDREYKQDLRDRDGNCCLNPYCSSNNPSDLTIHHIDYDKKNCHPSNLITVCRSCNSCANVNRQWHKAWYQAIMYRRYNYIY